MLAVVHVLGSMLMLFSAAYLLPIVHRAFLRPPPMNATAPPCGFLTKCSAIQCCGRSDPKNRGGVMLWYQIAFRAGVTSSIQVHEL